MTRELKQAMKLMKSNKEYKVMFGWHPVCLVVYVVTAMLTGGGFLIDRILGNVSSSGNSSFSVYSRHFSSGCLGCISAIRGRQC